MGHSLFRHLPNLLSILRLLLALYFPFSPQEQWLWMVIIGGSSDVLDGWIARRYNLQSWVGGIIDGVADKLFMLMALITLANSGIFALWLLPFILARDLLVAGTALYAAAIRSWSSFKEMNVRLAGKLATAAQFLLLLVGAGMPAQAYLVLIPAVLLSILSASDYGYLFFLALQRQAGEQKN